MSFYESIWAGEGIGDGSNLEEALQAYSISKPRDFNWEAALTMEGANPHVDHYSSFENFLDNDDPIETIQVTAAMIIENLECNPTI